jgi:hypothetical protein
MEKKGFENWTFEDIQDEFGIVKLSKIGLGTQWAYRMAYFKLLAIFAIMSEVKVVIGQFLAKK